MNRIEPIKLDPVRQSKTEFRYQHYVCRDAGFVVASLKSGTPGDYVFRCWCNRGKNLFRRFPKWDPVRFSELAIQDMEAAS